MIPNHETERVFEYLTGQYVDALFYNLDVEAEAADWYAEALAFLADRFGLMVEPLKNL